MSWFVPGQDEIIGSDDRGAIYLGRYWNAGKQRVEGKLRYGGPRHVTVLGPNGSGKGARLLITNLLEIEGKSIVVLDPKGQNAAVTAPWRRKISDVLILNPFGVLIDVYPDLESVGFNPLAPLDPRSRSFCDDSAGVAEAIVEIHGNELHWPESARGFGQGGTMWEVKEADRESHPPSLENVRALLTEPDEY